MLLSLFRLFRRYFIEVEYNYLKVIIVYYILYNKEYLDCLTIELVEYRSLLRLSGRRVNYVLIVSRLFASRVSIGPFLLASPVSQSYRVAV